MRNKPAVLVYREQLLPYSETFIRSQAENLAYFEAFYAGVERIAGIPLDPARCMTVVPPGERGRAARLAFKGLGIAPALKRKAARLEPKLIHAHFQDGGMQALPLARALGAPLVVTCHGCDVTVNNRSRNPLRRAWFERRFAGMLEYGAQFIAVSAHIHRKMLELGYPAEAVATHFIGVDTQKFRRTREPEINPMVLFVGRLVEKKGCAFLIEAMARVQKTIPTAKLVIAGDGPLREALESRAGADLGRVHFLGVQSPEAIQDLMQRASVLCVPSVTAENGDTEGLPLVVCEAQAMELPVAGFDHAGIPEAVEQGKTGLLCAEKDSRQLADNLLTLLGDRDLRNRFGAAARARACAEFDLKAQSAILEGYYRKAAGMDTVAKRADEILPGVGALAGAGGTR